MPGIDDIVRDEDYIIYKAKEAQKYNIYAAKAWMLTAKTLYPTNFKIQFEAYIMEKQSKNVKEAAECFSSLLSVKQNIVELLPEISSIANSLKSNETNFLCQMFDNIRPDIQLTILKTSIENSDDIMEHCKLLILLLKKFPQLSVESLVKTLINADKFFHDQKFARLLIVETLPLLSSLESPRLLQRLLVKALDFYNSYIYDEVEHDIPDPWQRLYSVLELLGKQLGWDPYLINYNNCLNKESYYQKLTTLRSCEDCRQLLYCGTTFFLKSLYEHKSLIGNHLLIEALAESGWPQSKKRKGDIEVTGVSALEFQAAANTWELLHNNEVISREFSKVINKLRAKPWSEGFCEELALYKGRYEESIPISLRNGIVQSLLEVSIHFSQKRYSNCIEFVYVTLTQLPNIEGNLEPELIVGGTHRHLHFLSLTKMAIMQYICTVLIRVMLNLGSNIEITNGHILTLMQLSWPQEESIFMKILDGIKQKGVFHYNLFKSYIIHIDILEELCYLWNEQGNNVMLDILPNSQHLGQRRIGTRGADKGVKEDFKQAMRAQVTRSNESLLNLLIQFLNSERSYFFQLA